MQLAQKTKEFLEEKRREWHVENPHQPTTKKAFAEWLGVSEFVYSDYTTDIPRNPTRRQVQIIARHYPEIYEVIERIEWRPATHEERREQGEITLAELVAGMTDEERRTWEELKSVIDTRKAKKHENQTDFINQTA
jgi:hypothetical protein